MTSRTTEERAKFAELVKTSANKSYLFTLFKGQSIALAIWDSIRPGHEMPFSQRSEDAS